MHRVLQQPGALLRRQQLGTDEGPVDQHGKLAGKPVRLLDTKPASDGRQPLAHRVHVRSRHEARRMVVLGEFGGHVDLRASTVVRARQALAYPAHVGVELPFRIIRVPGGHLIPHRPEVDVLALEEGHDQVILGGEIAVQAGLGDACLLDDQVDPDSPHAPLVEQRGSDRQDVLLQIGRIARPPAPWGCRCS